MIIIPQYFFNAYTNNLLIINVSLDYIFEEMTKKAQEGEESKLLMSVLIGSDVGRLYMVLADVLKKEL